MIGTLLAKRAVASAFDALNRKDLEAFMAGWRDDGVFIYPGDIPESGVFSGRAAVEGWFRRFFEQYQRITFDVHAICLANPFDFLGDNVAAAYWDISLLNKEGHQGTNSGVTVITIKGGKVLRVQDFIFDLGEAFHRNWSAPFSAATSQQM